MSVRRIRAMFTKELRHIVRDTRSLIMALGVPVLLLVLFGYALSLDVDRIPTIVYDQDETPQSRDLIHSFRGSRYFALQTPATNYRVIERAIDTGSVLMAVVIPRRFGEKVTAGQRAEVQLLLDGSDSNTA